MAEGAGMWCSLGLFGYLVVRSLASAFPQSLREDQSGRIRLVGAVAYALTLGRRFGLLPSSLVARSLILCQDDLRKHVSNLFDRFPSTGVYEPNVDEFQVFCERVCKVRPPSSLPRGSSHP